MTDYAELKRAAEAVLGMSYPWEHTVRDGRLGKTSTEYARLAHPSNVLALIAENESLRGSCRAMGSDMGKVTRERNAFRAKSEKLKAEIAGLQTDRKAYEQLNAELTVEVEALRKAIADIHSALEREYWSEYAGLEVTRAILDAAMGQGEQL